MGTSYASVRRECLSQHWFLNLEDAQKILNSWGADYNEQRPHSSLGDLPPALYRAGGVLPDQTRLENSHM